MARVIRVSTALLDRVKAIPQLPCPDDDNHIEDFEFEALAPALPEVRCCWCFTPKNEPKRKCEICGFYGVTRMRESDLRRVYVEEC
jgi:hypothetical protein